MNKLSRHTPLNTHICLHPAASNPHPGNRKAEHARRHAPLAEHTPLAPNDVVHVVFGGAKRPFTQHVLSLIHI